MQALLYGLLPGSAQELTSHTVYRWECAVRASVVMGFVGAGGLGQLMDQAMKMLNGGEASTILLTFLALVLAADAFSGILRRHVANAGTQPRPRRYRSFRHRLHRPASGRGRRQLRLPRSRPCRAFSRESAGLVGDFLRAFFPPDLSPAWLARVAYGTLETLAISAVGTLLAVLAGFALALPASGRYGAVAGQVSRFALNALRSVPELVWATLTALSVGLGPSPACWRWPCTPPACSVASSPRRWKTRRRRRAMRCSLPVPVRPRPSPLRDIAGSDAAACRPPALPLA